MYHLTEAGVFLNQHVAGMDDEARRVRRRLSGAAARKICEPGKFQNDVSPVWVNEPAALVVLRREKFDSPGRIQLGLPRPES